MAKTKKQTRHKDVEYFIREIKLICDSISPVVKNFEDCEQDLVRWYLKDALKHLTKKDKKEVLELLNEAHDLLEYDFTYLNGEVARCIDSIIDNKLIKWEGYTPW